MVLYFDAAQERVEQRSTDEFEAAVEAARLGAVFSRNQRAYQRWASKQSMSKNKKSLTGAALEAAVAGVARIFPGNVIHEAR